MGLNWRKLSLAEKIVLVVILKKLGKRSEAFGREFDALTVFGLYTKAKEQLAGDLRV